MFRSCRALPALALLGLLAVSARAHAADGAVDSNGGAPVGALPVMTPTTPTTPISPTGEITIKLPDFVTATPADRPTLLSRLNDSATPRVDPLASRSRVAHDEGTPVSEDMLVPLPTPSPLWLLLIGALLYYIGTKALRVYR